MLVMRCFGTKELFQLSLCLQRNLYKVRSVFICKIITSQRETFPLPSECNMAFLTQLNTVTIKENKYYWYLNKVGCCIVSFQSYNSALIRSHSACPC